MLTNFLLLLKYLVEKNCVLQSFYPGYIADINAMAITKYPALSIWFETLVGRKEQRENGLFRVFELTCEFLTLQGYFNDNTVDDTYKQELYKARKWDELQQVSDAFFHDLHRIEKDVCMDPTSPMQFMLSDISAGRFSRSGWLNSQSGSQYKANQANARLVSIMQTFTVAFPLHLCEELCSCTAGEYTLPPFETINPKNLVKPSELKC